MLIVYLIDKIWVKAPNKLQKPLVVNLTILYSLALLWGTFLLHSVKSGVSL